MQSEAKKMRTWYLKLKGLVAFGNFGKSLNALGSVNLTILVSLGFCGKSLNFRGSLNLRTWSSLDLFWISWKFWNIMDFLNSRLWIFVLSLWEFLKYMQGLEFMDLAFTGKYSEILKYQGPLYLYILFYYENFEQYLISRPLLNLRVYWKYFNGFYFGNFQICEALRI